MNEGGLWFSGAAGPWLSEWDRTVFMACQPSYHLKQAPDRSWQLRALLTVPVPGHSSPLVAAAVERSNLALAASAVMITDAPDDASGQYPDDVRTASANSTDASPDLGGQHPDDVSELDPDASAAITEAVASLLLSPQFLDRLTDALDNRVAERAEMDAEVERLAARMNPEAAELAAAAVGGVPEGAL